MNTKTTIITSAIVPMSVHCMSSTLARMVPVRSARTETSMPAGIQRFSSGISARICFTVSMTFASACLVTLISTEGWPLNQAEERVLRTPSSTCATDDSRTVLPSWLRTTRLPNCGGRRSCSLVLSDQACSGPSMAPTGPSAFVLAMVVRMVSRLSPIAASWLGLTRTRTAGCSAPLTLTSATPGDLRDALRDHRIRDVVDRARLHRRRGQRQDQDRRRGAGSPCGRSAASADRSAGRRCDAFNAACTSRAALSIFRERSNWT